MPLPPDNQQGVIEFYSKILARAGILDEVKSVVVSKSLLGSGEGDGLNLGENKEFVTIELNLNLIQDKTPSWEEDDKPSSQKIGSKSNKEKVEKPRSPLLELFLKKRPSCPEKGILFDREVFFYGVFLPDAIAFTEERDKFKEVELGVIFAKCYHADADMILLENVTKRGLIMTPIKQPHTFIQAEMILENIGRFHAVTHVMVKTLGLEAFKLKYASLVEENVFSSEKHDIHAKYWETTLEMASAVLKGKPVSGWSDGLQFFKKYKGKLFTELCELVTLRPEDVLVGLNFGDIWNGNVFVKADQDKRRYTSAVFIKPTMTRFGSPMLDVSCYMHSCVADHIRLTNYEYLLDVFFEFIRDKSEELGVDFDMELDELKVLYIGKSCYGIFRAIDYLLTKFYRKHLQPEGDSFDLVKFETWLKENPDHHYTLAEEIVSKIHQYELCLQELTEHTELE